jgi:hypothetical protein
MSEEKPDLIILVHGTFAALPEDKGDAWWQSGSDFWNKLNARLAGKARCTGPGEVFHWTGENLESDRRAASHQLADLFEDLEQKGQPYHVIAHSHGGNVLLSALFRCHGRLTLLRSWSTVGTPFFRYHDRGFLRGALTTSMFVGSLGVLLTAAGLLLANWFEPDPTNPGVFRSFLYVSSVLAILIGILGCFIGGLMFYSTIDRGGAAFEMAFDELLRKEARTKWSSRWLSLWSAEDEAITGLSSAFKVKKDLLSKAVEYDKDRGPLRLFQAGRGLVPWWKRWFVAVYSAMARAATRTLEFFWLKFCNGWWIPFQNHTARTVLINHMMGHDSIGSGVTSIRSVPFELELHVPEIPEGITASLVRKANEGLRKSTLLEQSRNLLAQAAMGGMSFDDIKASLAKTLSGKELVHTGYFDNDDIIEMLAVHVESARSETPSCARPEIKNWLNIFYEKSDQRCI